MRVSTLLSIQLHTEMFGLFDEAEMARQLSLEVSRVNDSRGFADPIPAEPPTFGKGGTNWWEGWARDWVFTYEHYVPGTYDALMALKQSNDDMLVPPFSREANFNRNLDGNFWASKGTNDNGELRVASPRRSRMLGTDTRMAF